MRHMMLAALLAAIGAGAHAGEADLIGTYTVTNQNRTQEAI